MPYKDYEQKKKVEKQRYWENKEYRNEYSREYAKQNREKINKITRELRNEKKEFLTQHLGGKCCGCGTAENLQFDHIDRKLKSFTIGKCLTKKLDVLIGEAEKCQLLCKSCHQLKTTINHDMNSLTEGYAVLNVVENGDEIIVTLKKIN